MKSAQKLRTKITGGSLTVGMLVIDHYWHDVIEIAMNAGLDYLIVDQEHSPFTDERVAEGCAIGRRLDFPILIRPRDAESALVRRAADLGACGFLLPRVESAAALDEVRNGLYMPPRGGRRPGGVGNRWVRDVNYATWRDEVENDFIVLPQIENRRGLENVDEIARHPITTAIAVGPYDLSADLGVCYDPSAPVHVEALARIRQAGRAAGKTMWMIGDGPTLMRAGYTFICIGEPTLFLEAMLTRAVSALRASPDTTAPKPV
jgi:2-keto-3-deoxy-L-rhamnonate aldolase RhmA